MYFFYIDESGSRDPQTTKIKPDGTVVEKDPIYVLTAVGMYERKWKKFESHISMLKLELIDQIKRSKKLEFTPLDCEVKSTWLRLPRLRQKESPFLANLSDADLRRVSEAYFDAVAKFHIVLFSVVVDKRCIHDHMTDSRLHIKAYEILLERIEAFMDEFHPKHQALIISDHTSSELNRNLAMKHAYFQREGNRYSHFHHIVEYPFFTDSRLSNGVQLADICGYNVYRVFKHQNWSYEWFQRILPHFYCSGKTHDKRLDGLYVWPSESSLLQFAVDATSKTKESQPELWNWDSGRPR